MSESQPAMFFPLNIHLTMVECEHRSRFVYSGELSKWVTLIRHEGCSCPMPPAYDVMQEYWNSKRVETDLLKDAPAWALVLWEALQENHRLYEVLVGDMGSFEEKLAKREAKEEEKESSSNGFDLDDVVGVVTENEKIIDSIIDIMKDTRSNNGVEIFNYLSMPTRRKSLR